MEFDLRRYVQVVVGWWWLLVIGTVVPVLVSYHFLSQQDDIYQARVVLMVGTTLQSANPDTGEMGAALRLARGYAEMVRMRPVTNAVIEVLGLQLRPDDLQWQISAGVRPEANLLEIYVTDVDPEAAALIANALAEELINQSPAAQTQGEQQRFVERQLTDLKSKIEKIELEIEKQTAELADLTSSSDIRTSEENLDSLETVVSRYRSEYAQYLQSYVGGSVNQLTIVEPATAPELPVAGKKLLILGIAGAAGLGLAVAGVFLIEYSDDTLKWGQTRGETLLDWPVLGGLGRTAIRKDVLLELPNEQSPEAESLRALRANLLLSRLRHSFQTILISSSDSQDGKSWVSANLGVILAAAGLRVIVVDGDMRKPSLHRLFDLPNVFGLADLIDQATPLADLETLRGLQEAGPTNLWLLSAGKMPLDPLMLLMSLRFSVLVEILRDRADIIIFDAPPMLMFSDASVLASHSDISILVVAHEMTTRRQIRQISEYLQEHREVKVLGAVFNYVRLREQGAYSYYRRRKSFSAELAKLSGFVRSLRRSAELSPDDPERLIPVPEAAEALGITRAMARRWIKTGRLPATKQHLRYRVRQGDLRALIELETTGATDPFTFATGNRQHDASATGTITEAGEIAPVR